ncbi:MAG: SCO1664 family protein [Anaerolineae bacterium]|nr:SCO1664 family protein [Anaerolineae bacterium]
MSDNQPQELSFGRVLEILQKGDIDAEHGMMRWSSNYTFMVSVTHENTNIMAIYKPQRGERPLWDFPDGMLCKREVAAFITSEELGWQIVPPTTLREGPRGLGSVQFFINHDPEVNYFTFDSSLLSQVRRIAAFDYIVNNADRKGGHCLLDSSGHVWGIDHGITFHSSPKLRTVIWDFAGQDVPDALLNDMQRLLDTARNPDCGFSKELVTLINDREIAAFQHRLEHLLRTKRFPKPGASGPNYPWPPV